MDPVTGIGLAASVVQLVSFSIDVAKICQSIYDNGSTSDNAQADQTANRLLSLTASLQKSLHDSETQSTPLSGEEREIMDLAHKSEDCARRLQSELAKVQALPRTSILNAARKTARSVWKRGTIVKIQEELEGYRRVLETSLLYRLSQRFDAQNLITNGHFAKSNETLKYMATCLAQSQTSFETLIKQEAARQEQFHIDERFYDEVLRSLFYPEISSRQEHVANEFHGIEDSYDWIFSDQFSAVDESKAESEKPPEEQRWANFSEWLKSGKDVYWINGKAGSGKSTLMNFICEHPQKDELLKEWSGERRLLTPSFFFWNAGVRQQKTVDGLLRSLIYQILAQYRELIVCFKNEVLHSWTEKRLLNALFALLTQTQAPVAICVFIDGLDEFEGQYESMVEKLKTISRQSHAKICLSSRPLAVFETAFAKTPSLKLQDLTFNSILAYAENQLSHLIEERLCYGSHDGGRLRRLLREIVDRSEGVFLWAVTAIRDVREGLQDAANLNELESMIRDLPPGIENLYLQMLERIKPAYRQEAIRLLQIVLIEPAMHLYRFFFIADERSPEDQPFRCNPIEMNALVKSCHDLRKQILTHTLGLLDVIVLPASDRKSNYIYYQVCSDNAFHEILLAGVNVHHRTVIEFFAHNAAAKSFVEAVGSKETSLRLYIARGSLTYLDHISQKKTGTPLTLRGTLQGAIRHIASVERVLDVAQSKLMRSIDACDFLREGTIEPKGYGHHGDPFYFYLSEDRNEGSLDPVGVAASYGMVRYICETLGLSMNDSGGSLATLLDFQQLHSTNEATAVPLLLTEAAERKVYNPDYRLWVSKHMKWKYPPHETFKTRLDASDRPLAETYLLHCIGFENLNPNSARVLTLVRILLRAGADPMAMMQVPKSLGYKSTLQSCWLVWMRLLHRRLYMTPEGETTMKPDYNSGLDLPINIEQRLPMDELFNTTKAFLIQGADINTQVNERLDSGLSVHRPLMRGNLSKSELDFEIRVSAMLYLEKWFHGYQEWRSFAAATKAPLISPWKRIVSIYHNVGAARRKVNSSTWVRVHPGEEEAEMLWPLIEKWEESGEDSDLDQLKAAMRQVFNAHRPYVRLNPDKTKYEPYEESYQSIMESM